MTNAAIHNDDRLINIDILGALRRRKWIGLAVAIVGVVATIGIVMSLPATYKSTATILIEEPDVPQDLVKSTVSTYANDRLQIIQQRVMTSENLSQIIKEFGLYGATQQGQVGSLLIRALRSQVDLEVVSANLAGQPQNRYRQQPQASIAFTLAFEHNNPEIAQQVAGRLTDLYLGENNRSRQEKAAGTTSFLTDQAKKLYGDVQTLEQRLLELRSKYNGSLPEQFSMNTQLLNQAQSDLMQSRAQLQMATEKQAFLQSQLATISPYNPVTASGQPTTPQSQLMSLQLQYSDLSSRYGTKHPDVIRLKRQIDTLKKQMGVSGAPRPSNQDYAQLQSQLSDTLQRYGENHPETKRLRRQLDEMKADMDAPATLSSQQGPPDNPIYIQMQAQLADSNAQIGALRDRTAQLEQNVADLQQRILQTPRVEAEYNSLRDQHNLALQRYQSFKDKESDAEVAENMEQQSKGETFSVIDPARLPDVPESPNRQLLIAAGIFLTGMLAAAVMLAVDMLDPRIFDPKNLLHAFGEMPLVTVPYIPAGGETRSRTLRLIGAAGIAVILIAGVLAIALPQLAP
ncbi:MAG TPA: Wzz/FepE/Etk N-terminal domain-containing protein [Dongiaceae bacterium]|nr:Wzz/FepE/Etk N-terminal domain-containing protein [Dongiaceae bacterium]